MKAITSVFKAITSVDFSLKHPKTSNTKKITI
jgi:hypothetical protein